ncbi:hypothetical protein FDW95_08315 [Citrobacter sp. wls718]|jgi:hypothetical protein|nr:hypothetical protein FDW95_08315 [Citrobacter sp. wls718]STE18213.1 Uncharacterised protein [Escherichia coli]
MKNNFFRWFVVFITLMMAMSSISFFALFIKPVVSYFETGVINVSIINCFFLSIKMGPFKCNEIY